MKESSSIRASTKKFGCYSPTAVSQLHESISSPAVSSCCLKSCSQTLPPLRGAHRVQLSASRFNWDTPCVTLDKWDCRSIQGWLASALYASAPEDWLPRPHQPVFGFVFPSVWRAYVKCGEAIVMEMRNNGDGKMLPRSIVARSSTETKESRSKCVYRRIIWLGVFEEGEREYKINAKNVHARWYNIYCLKDVKFPAQKNPKEMEYRTESRIWLLSRLMCKGVVHDDKCPWHNRWTAIRHWGLAEGPPNSSSPLAVHPFPEY